MTYKINITALDIEKGKKKEITDCPIARSAKRIFKKRFRGVTCSQLYLNRRILIDLPPEAILFITNFDRGFFVKPFSFKLTIRERK